MDFSLLGFQGLRQVFNVHPVFVHLDFNPKYPKDLKTLGERIRKARMDRHMMAKELAQKIGVVPETVTNWEKRNLKPTRRHLEGLRAVLGLGAETAGSRHSDRQSQS